MLKWNRPSRLLLGFLVLTVLLLSAASPGWSQVPGEGVTEATPQAFMNRTGDAPDPEDQTFLQLLEAGGTVMYVLGVLSIVLFFLIIYYFMTLRVGRIVSKPLLRKVYSLLSDDNASDAAVLCERSSGMMPKILSAGLKHVGHGRETIMDAMESVGSREAELLRRRVTYLDNIARIAPLLGLLGTIIGMIQAFQAVAFDPAMSKPIVLATGIQKALVTTATGLIIAIIASVFYFYFRGTVAGIITLVEEISVEFAEKIVSVKTPVSRDRGVGLR